MKRLNGLPRPAHELERLERAWRKPTGWNKLSDVNNSFVGLIYIATAMLFFVLAGLLALAMRAQLAVADNSLVPPTLYNQLFTMHGTVMMFLFAVPIVEAVAVYLLPAMLGARDLPFPRLGAYAFWTYAIGGLAFFATLFFGVAPDGGWFMYPPLTDATHSPGLGADFWLLGIGFIEISAIAGAVELIIGVLMTRAPGMTLGRMPVFAWTMLVVGLMVVFAFPAVIAGTMLLELERAFGWPYFDTRRGGDPLLWQHLFWFFGHPEVYIIFLPAAGLVSTMIPALARTPLVGHGAVIAAISSIAVISFALWIHHMFTAGLGPLALMLTSAASLAIAIPSAAQVFAWIATLWRGVVRWDAAGLFLFGFFFTFVLGGLTGVMVAVLPFDAQVHDTYFVVAHLHYVLIGGMVFPLIAAFYHWAPLVNGHSLSESMGRWVFALMFAGFHITFFPMHVLGLMGMPRRVYTYAADLGWWPWNLLSSIGAVLIAAGVLLLLFDVARWLRLREREPGNPWQAPGLEWLSVDTYGVRSIPAVATRYPLWDQPELAHEVPAGRHWLPGTATGGRETLVTSALAAVPRFVMRVPGPSWLPLAAAVGTAGFFLLLTVKQVLLAFVAGVLGVAAIIGWLWEVQRPAGPERVEAAQGISLPLGAAGRGSPGWWAMLIVLAVDASIFLSFAFSHLHISMQLTSCPPPGASLPAAHWTWATLGSSLAASVLILAGARRLNAAPPATPSSPARWMLLSLLASGSALAALLLGAEQGGLQARADAWSATVAVLLAWQAFHVLVLLVMVAYVIAMWLCKLPAQSSRASFHNVALFCHWSNLQAALVALVPIAVAWGMR